MSVTQLHHTGGIPAIKFMADSVEELDTKIKHASVGDMGVVDDTSYYKKTKNATAFTSLEGAEVSGTILSAAVLDLFSNPIEVIAAPGAGRMILVDEIQLYLDHTSADYVADAGEDLSFQYFSTANEIARIDSDNGFITASADSRLVLRPKNYY